ncbi:MAG: baculoviral IAP repeat-containing protein, partial [Magnetococcus sp. YQC-3]
MGNIGSASSFSRRVFGAREAQESSNGENNFCSQLISGTAGNVENSPSQTIFSSSVQREGSECRSVTVEDSSTKPSVGPFSPFIFRPEENSQQGGVEQDACCGCLATFVRVDPVSREQAVISTDAQQTNLDNDSSDGSSSLTQLQNVLQDRDVGGDQHSNLDTDSSDASLNMAPIRRLLQFIDGEICGHNEGRGEGRDVCGVRENGATNSFPDTVRLFHRNRQIAQRELLSQMYNESMRYTTFFTVWSSRAVSPRALAKAGFFYFKEKDLVQCPFCFGILGDWVPSDDPFEEHKKFFPNCPFIC